MSCACGVQCERPCNAEPGSVCEDCQCRRDAEHRAELDQCQTDLKSARHSLLQSDNQVARLVAENDRLKGELAKETKRSAALEALVDMERQVRKETENTLFFVRAELLKVQDDLLQGANREVMAEALIERLRGELGEAQRVISACAHVPCVLASMSRTPGAVPRSCGSCGTCSARKQLVAPPPAESTPVQDADETKHVLGMIRNPPPPTDALKAAMARTPPAPPDDIRERLDRLEEWASMRERGPFRAKGAKP